MDGKSSAPGGPHSFGLGEELHNIKTLSFHPSRLLSIARVVQLPASGFLSASSLLLHPVDYGSRKQHQLTSAVSQETYSFRQLCSAPGQERGPWYLAIPHTQVLAKKGVHHH